MGAKKKKGEGVVGNAIFCAIRVCRILSIPVPKPIPAKSCPENFFGKPSYLPPAPIAVCAPSSFAEISKTV